MWSACEAMKDMMIQLGISIDGGKDSLSMAAKVEGETVKAPGSLTISAYCTTQNINLCITPDLKASGSAIVYVSLGESGKFPLGGSAFAQTLGVVGGDCPDFTEEDVHQLKQSFEVTQSQI